MMCQEAKKETIMRPLFLQTQEAALFGSLDEKHRMKNLDVQRNYEHRNNIIRATKRFDSFFDVKLKYAQHTTKHTSVSRPLTKQIGAFMQTAMNPDPSLKPPTAMTFRRPIDITKNRSPICVGK
jgi:hypothetical protein